MQDPGVHCMKDWSYFSSLWLQLIQQEKSMFTKLIDTVIFHTAFAAGYSCHKTADGLRTVADKLDVAGHKLGGIAVVHGLACGKFTQEEIDAVRAKAVADLKK